MVKLWNIHAQKELATLEAEIGEKSAIAFSSEGNILATVSVDNRVKL
jgi:WD40 repeat protein